MNESYIQYKFCLPEGEEREILLAQLQADGFNGFEETETKLIGYITANEETTKESFGNYRFSKHLIEKKNWNEEWEKNFESVQIESFVNIRADFHPPVKGFKHEIIMAETLGASLVTAMDNDEWSINNAIENIGINYCKNIQVTRGNSINALEVYDIILANINKNVITEHLHSLIVALNENGCLLLSGLLVSDKMEIQQVLTLSVFNSIQTIERNGWICVTSRRL